MSNLFLFYFTSLAAKGNNALPLSTGTLGLTPNQAPGTPTRPPAPSTPGTPTPSTPGVDVKPVIHPLLNIADGKVVYFKYYS